MKLEELASLFEDEEIVRGYIRFASYSDIDMRDHTASCLLSSEKITISDEYKSSITNDIIYDCMYIMFYSTKGTVFLAFRLDEKSGEIDNSKGFDVKVNDLPKFDVSKYLELDRGNVICNTVKNNLNIINSFVREHKYEMLEMFK